MIMYQKICQNQIIITWKNIGYLQQHMPYLEFYLSRFQLFYTEHKLIIAKGEVF